MLSPCTTTYLLLYIQLVVLLVKLYRMLLHHLLNSNSY